MAGWEATFGMDQTLPLANPDICIIGIMAEPNEITSDWMPLKLSAEDMQKALEWLNTKSLQDGVRVAKCSACGTQKMSLLNGLVRLPISSGHGYTAVIGACDNCGKFEMFSAHMIGIDAEKYL